MSRIGRKPIAVPAGVKVTIEGRTVSATGPKGTLSREIPGAITFILDADVITVARPDDSKTNRAMHGLCRTLIANMVEGVATGFRTDLEINGVGYRANLEGKNLNLQLGYSHDIKYPIPEGIAIKVGEKQTTIAITGADKQKVGQVAAEIRGLRRPEPYKGKGIKYDTEQVRRKEGKKK